jgi:hypothetical protein
MMMTSSHLFTLASDYGVPFSDGPLEDEQLLGFRESYLKWSDQRDRELVSYLQRNSNLFRVYLPYSNRMLRTALQVVWYLDEVVLRDPIASELIRVSTEVKSEKDRERIEEQKEKIRYLIQSLSAFRSAVDQGYLLLAGPSMFPDLPDPPADKVEGILDSPGVRPAIVEAMEWAYARFEDARSGATGHIFKGSLDSSTWCNWCVTIPPKETAEIPMQLGLRRIPYTDLCGKLGYEPLEQPGEPNRQLMQHVFSKAVAWSINSVARAHQFGSAALFDREVDETILQQTSGQTDEGRQTASVGILNVLLPYVRNIPVERLADLREEMPDAFRDFRGRILEVVNAARDEVQSDVELRQRVEREIVPELRFLDAEINAALSRAKVLQLGIPIASAVAALAGLKLGVDAKWILGGLSAASLKVLVETASKVETMAKVKGHPFYFLWKAGQE